MNQRRDDPARQRQFLVICAIGFFGMLYAYVSAGGFEPVVVDGDGFFKGGPFVYKFTQRDYAASDGLAAHIAREIGLEPNDQADAMYTVYLDDPRRVSGFRSRFAAGYLATNGDSESRQKQKELTAKNKLLVDPEPTDVSEFKHTSCHELWPKLRYRTASFPKKVPAAVVQFPHTTGFVTALLLQYKVLPALRDYAEQRVTPAGSPVVVLTTCSPKEGMCTHYAPLRQSNKFLLGLPSSEEYAASLEPEPMVDWKGVWNMFHTMFPFLKYLTGGAKTSEKEEL